MSISKATIKYKIISSKILLNLMNKELVSIDEITKKASIDYKKKRLREEQSKIQEKYSADKIDKKILKEQITLYNLELTKLELEYNKISRLIQQKDLFYKRLEIIHNILNHDDEDKHISIDDLYLSLLEVIKDEYIKDLEIRLKINKLILLINDYDNNLTKNEICKYQDEIYEIKLELKETKKVLKVDKLEKIKNIQFEKLVESSTTLLNELYGKEIYEN